MPAQTPFWPITLRPGRSDSLTIARSRPAPIPSRTTPRTSTANGSGVEPLTTVRPSPLIPAVTVAAGTGAGQGEPTSAVADGAATAGAAAAPATRASSAPALAAAGLRRWNHLFLVIKTLPIRVDTTAPDVGARAGRRPEPTSSTHCGQGRNRRILHHGFVTFFHVGNAW